MDELVLGPMKFPLGRLVMTASVDELINKNPELSAALQDALTRYCKADWGEIAAGDEGMNDDALANGGRLHAVYPFGPDQTLWIITEYDRSVTTCLLPEDY